MERLALVTGAAHGIGAGIAARLAREGWAVALADRDQSGAALAAGLGPLARFIQADISMESEVERVVATLGDRLDALVCNAGFMIRKPLAETTLDEWTAVLATNLTSTFLLARAAETRLRAARGAIVTIASTRARMSEPDTASYSATKGGLVALTHSLAVSLGPDVRCNCVSPGWIDVAGERLRPEDHAQHPAGRVGTVEDIAAMVAFLVGPESGFVTGAEFVVDGGMTRRMSYVE